MQDVFISIPFYPRPVINLEVKSNSNHGLCLNVQHFLPGKKFDIERKLNEVVLSVKAGSFSNPFMDFVEVRQVKTSVTKYRSVDHGYYALELEQVELQSTFQKLAEQWQNETAILSSIKKKIEHPAYQEIIKMGQTALPLILRELQREPNHWFWALFTITGQDPTNPEDDFDQAVEAWLQWGKDKRLID